MRTKYVPIMILVIYGIFSFFLELSIALTLPLPWYWRGTIMAGLGVVLSLFGRELI
ncbi:hypothetical protein [Candidatus Methanoliparum sp. LAM-1]|uniref:hypothetical protein n=1 Tax=Candidatus Methanoliparum sp. LAM-1 TaxID=2874846 RepID=UPI001E61F780|nr:hypothetical protein [Candidatus Methanoliparum sp. LAM-1]BDC36505.1 hypothetical protein MTLP_11870 [Candidatus Methanoliparum sp. LAM-1]